MTSRADSIQLIQQRVGDSAPYFLTRTVCPKLPEDDQKIGFVFQQVNGDVGDDSDPKPCTPETAQMPADEARSRLLKSSGHSAGRLQLSVHSHLPTVI